MLDVKCMNCQRKFQIGPENSQYQKLKLGKTKLFVCSSCNQSVQGQASAYTGINPNDFDEHDRILNKK